jgi:hypothetical protein
MTAVASSSTVSSAIVAAAQEPAELSLPPRARAPRLMNSVDAAAAARLEAVPGRRRAMGGAVRLSGARDRLLAHQQDAIASSTRFASHLCGRQNPCKTCEHFADFCGAVGLVALLGSVFWLLRVVFGS